MTELTETQREMLTKEEQTWQTAGAAWMSEAMLSSLFCRLVEVRVELGAVKLVLDLKTAEHDQDHEALDMVAAQLAEAKAILSDLPDHSDLDAAVFEANALRRQLTDAKEKLEKANKLFKEYRKCMHEWVRWEETRGK